MARFNKNFSDSAYETANNIDTEFQNVEDTQADMLSRKSGDTPNNMETDLDLGSNDILNAGSLSAQRLLLSGNEVFSTVAEVTAAVQAQINSNTTNIANNTQELTVVSAEGTLGRTEVANQAETNAGTNDTKIVTPLKLANFSGLGGQNSPEDKNWPIRNFSLNSVLAFGTDNNAWWRKSNTSALSINVPDSTNAAYVGTSFVVHNDSSSGNITVDRSDTVTSFTEGATSSSAITVLPRETKLFQRIANNAYSVYPLHSNSGVQSIIFNRMTISQNVVGATTDLTELSNIPVDENSVYEVDGLYRLQILAGGSNINLGLLVNGGSGHLVDVSYQIISDGSGSLAEDEDNSSSAYSATLAYPTTVSGAHIIRVKGIIVLGAGAVTVDNGIGRATSPDSIGLQSNSYIKLTKV